MKIFAFLGKFFGPLGILLTALFQIFDFDEVERWDGLKDFLRSELKTFRDQLRERFGPGKIEVNGPNIALLFKTFSLALDRFHSLQQIHDFLVQMPQRRPEWQRQAEDNEVDDALAELDMSA
jgi:hypothetical protein